MESLTHRNLKLLAAAYLRAEGCCAVGLEVRCPASRYRVDVAGYQDRLPLPAARDDQGGPTLWSTINGPAREAKRGRCEPRTIIIECKQSRGDFIRDDRKAEELFALRTELLGWKAHLEENRIKPFEPELRQSDTALFNELEDWDFGASRLPSYRKVLARLRAVEKQLYGETKFSLIARYRLADRCLLATPRGLLRPREVPAGWGLIEFRRSQLRSDSPGVSTSDNGQALAGRLAVEPPAAPSRSAIRARLLRNIAAAATRDALRHIAAGAGARDDEDAGD